MRRRPSEEGRGDVGLRQGGRGGGSVLEAVRDEGDGQAAAGDRGGTSSGWGCTAPCSATTKLELLSFRLCSTCARRPPLDFSQTGLLINRGSA